MPDPISEEASARADSILAKFRYGPKEKVTMELLPVEVYMVECFRIIGVDGHTDNMALSLLSWGVEYRRLKEGVKPKLYIANGDETPVRPRRRSKVQELRLV